MSTGRAIRIWAHVVRHSQGAPVSVAHVCAAAVTGVGVDGVGATVAVAPTLRESVCATDDVAAHLEELQLTLGQGPSVDSFAEGTPVLAVDLLAPEYRARWPAFTPAALDSGAQAVFALPLQIGAIRLGVLDLYRVRPGELSADRLADALVFADTVGMLLLDATAGTYTEAAELAWQDEEPTHHHVVVHQATGMVLAQLGTTADAAFARLRAYAFAQDRRLGDVARDVVERRLRFEPDSDPLPDGAP